MSHSTPPGPPPAPPSVPDDYRDATPEEFAAEAARLGVPVPHNRIGGTAR